jgi:hypothetical protein
MVASTTRRSALALMAAGTVASIAAAEGAAKPKATAMTDIKQFCNRYYDASPGVRSTPGLTARPRR